MYSSTQLYKRFYQPDDPIQHQTPAMESIERNEKNESTGQEMKGKGLPYRKVQEKERK